MPLSGLLWSVCEGVSLNAVWQTISHVCIPPCVLLKRPLPPLWQDWITRCESLRCQVLSGVPRCLDCLLITLKNIFSGFHLHIVHWAQAVYSPLLNACCQHFAWCTWAQAHGAGAFFFFFSYQSESTCLHLNCILITSLGWQDVGICRSLWN